MAPTALGVREEARLVASARAAGERLRSRAARSRMMVRPMAKPRRRRRRAAPRAPSAAAGESHLNQARRARAAAPQNPPAARRSSLETAAAAARVEHHLTKTAGPLLKRRRPAPAVPSPVAAAAAAGPAPAAAAAAAAAPPLSYRRGPAAGPCPSNRARNRALMYLNPKPRPALMFRRRPRLSRAYPKASSPPGAGCWSFVKVR